MRLHCMNHLTSPLPTMQKVYPKILFGKATEYINDRKITQADDFLQKLYGIRMQAMYFLLLISGKAKLRTGLAVMMMQLNI